MTLYNFLIENESIINTLQNQQVMPISMNKYIEIYFEILAEQKKGKSKTDSYSVVANNRNLSIRTIFNVVEKMESEI